MGYIVKQTMPDGKEEYYDGAGWASFPYMAEVYQDHDRARRAADGLTFAIGDIEVVDYDK